MKVAEILIIIVAFLIGYFLSHITGGLVEGQGSVLNPSYKGEGEIVSYHR
jgi:hypothetical protein